MLTEPVVVQGPYLVRTVEIDKGTLEITGDWENTTSLEVFAPSSVSQIKFNGQQLSVKKTSYGSLTGELGAGEHSAASVQSLLPALTNWKVNDGLPERQANYDDSRWTNANHTSTPNPTPPETYPVLYSDEYGEFVFSS